MISLNDDWLSWPPDALDQFFQEEEQYEHPLPDQEKDNDSTQPDINH